MQTFTCTFGSKMKICFIDDFAKLSSHRKIPVEQFYNKDLQNKCLLSYS